MPGCCRAPDCGWATSLFTSAHSQFLCSDTNFLRLHPGCGPHTVFRWQVKLRYDSCPSNPHQGKGGESGELEQEPVPAGGSVQGMLISASGGFTYTILH